MELHVSMPEGVFSRVKPHEEGMRMKHAIR